MRVACRPPFHVSPGAAFRAVTLESIRTSPAFCPVCGFAISPSPRSCCFPAPPAHSSLPPTRRWCFTTRRSYASRAAPFRCRRVAPDHQPPNHNPALSLEVRGGRAAPIFLLAGGSGSSWLEQFEAEETNQEARFYQTVADIILFDQRDGGQATPAITCDGSAAPDAPRDLAVVSRIMQRLLVQCRDRWLVQDVDVTGKSPARAMCITARFDRRSTRTMRCVAGRRPYH